MHRAGDQRLLGCRELQIFGYRALDSIVILCLCSVMLTERQHLAVNQHVSSTIVKLLAHVGSWVKGGVLGRAAGRVPSGWQAPPLSPQRVEQGEDKQHAGDVAVDIEER